MTREVIPDLLIDADMYLFQAASACEVETDWGDDHWTLHSDAREVRKLFKRKIEEMVDELGGGNPVLCFSDPTRRTFRHDLYPNYKAGRGRKPLAYKAIRDELVEGTEFKTLWKPRLEADDCIGIVSTRAPGRFIVVSGDKDMLCIPGLLYRDGKVCEVSEAEARRAHMLQTLMGDVTDGYQGCPGIGSKRAAEVIKAEASPAEQWRAVLKCYSKAGLTAADALLQARLARILQASDWDFERSEVKLWEPPV